MPCEKTIYQQQQQPGSLVSAGFKVSAVSGGGGGSNENITSKRRSKNQHENGSKYYAVHKISTMSEQPIKLMQEDKSQISVVRKSYRLVANQMI